MKGATRNVHPRWVTKIFENFWLRMSSSTTSPPLCGEKPQKRQLQKPSERSIRYSCAALPAEVRRPRRLAFLALVVSSFSFSSSSSSSSPSLSLSNSVLVVALFRSNQFFRVVGLYRPGGAFAAVTSSTGVTEHADLQALSFIALRDPALVFDDTVRLAPTEAVEALTPAQGASQPACTVRETQKHAQGDGRISEDQIDQRAVKAQTNNEIT